MNNRGIKLVPLDLGGVLVELGDQLFPDSWLPEGQHFRLPEWFSSEVAIKFEKGMISSQQFIAELRSQLSIAASHEQVQEAFAAWPRGLFADTDGLLNRLKPDYELAVLSNSNELHEPILLQEFGLESRIDTIFFSHIIGHSKPDKEAFNHVLTTLGLKPNEVIFFDDSLINVRAALSLGIKAHQVSNPLEVGKYI